MSAFHDYRLTGGIFYAFLVDCMCESGLFNRPPHNNKQLTQPEVLCDLFSVFNPSFYYTQDEKDSIDTKSSTFKKCESNDRSFFLNVDGRTKLVEKETVLSNTADYLSRFNDFINKYRITKEPEHTKTLARRLLDLLSLDDSIPADEPLYVQADGTALEKSELLKTDTINCIPFLFGVWFYVCFRNEKNTIGKETYNHFWPKPKTEKHSIRVYKDSDPPLGSKFAQTTIIFQLRNNTKKVINLDQIEEDIQSNPVYSDLLNELKNDFKDLFEFILTNNPYKTSVYDYGEIDTIRDLIRKWKKKLLLMDNSFLTQTTQLLMDYLTMYVSFFDEPLIENRIIDNQIQEYTPKFNDETHRNELREVFLPESEAVIRSLKMLFSLICDPRDVK